MTSTIVAMITRTVHRTGQTNTQLLLDVATPEGQLAGIKATSAINCSNLFTVSEELLRRKIGQLPPHVMLQVNECLKAALDIHSFSRVAQTACRLGAAGTGGAPADAYLSLPTATRSVGTSLSRGQLYGRRVSRPPR